MDCPQCGTALTTYALQGHEALVCERCGYVGIEADHHGTPRSAESWHDALRRFYDESGVDSDPHVPVRPASPTGDDATGETPRDPSDRPDPRPFPSGAPAVRPAESATPAADASEDGGGADRTAETSGGKRGTDEDGSTVDDGVQSSAGDS